MFWRQNIVQLFSRAAIIDKTKINHDCYLYKFKFMSEPFTVQYGQHLRIFKELPTPQAPKGEYVARKYTPLSLPNEEHLTVLFKIYRPAPPQFPIGGVMTQHIESLNVGDQIELDGPFGKHQYQGSGQFVLDGKVRKFKHVVFLAGGSGITPVYHVMRQLTTEPSINLSITCLFYNKTQPDIILRKELEAMSPPVNMHFSVQSPPQNWQGLKGRFCQRHLQQVGVSSLEDVLYLYSGPRPMNLLIKQLLQTKPKTAIFKF